MASKLVKNATAPTPPATAAMMPTSAAWKRCSQASAAWTVGLTMLRIVGCGVGVGVGPGWAAGGVTGWLLRIGWRPLQRLVGARPPSTIAAMAMPRGAMATVPTMAG